MAEPERTRDFYALGRVTPGGQDARLHVDASVGIDRSQYDEIIEAIVSINHLSTPFHFKLVGRNLANLRDTHKLIVILLSLPGEFSSLNREYIQDAIFTSMVNWLTSITVFVDHTKFDIEKRFGRDSAEFKLFDDRRRQSYDTHPGYRFAYKLRNYVLHVGLPTLHIDVRRPSDFGSSSTLDQVARLYLDREALMRTWSNWGTVKSDLERLPEQFELMPLARDAMEAVIDMYDAVLDIYLSNAIAKVGPLRRALARVESEVMLEGDPCVFKFSATDSGDVCGLSPTSIPTTAVRTLGAIVDGEISRDSVKTFSDPPPRPRFDPSTVAARIHRDNRGVQVLSTWLANENDSGTLNSAVNEIIHEDRGIESLINGLLNVSGVLAHMTATLLGTEASGLIAGFLDIYPQYDEEEVDQ